MLAVYALVDHSGTVTGLLLIATHFVAYELDPLVRSAYAVTQLKCMVKAAASMILLYSVGFGCLVECCIIAQSI